MIKWIFGLIVCLVVPSGVWAESFVIDQYDVNVAIQSNGSLEINELINVTFSEDKHGIERRLPYRYQHTESQDEVFSYNNFSVNNQFTTFSDGPDKVLRIGNPDVLVNGAQSYNISYTVSPGIVQYSGYQEMYRNLVGTQRDTSIAQVNFIISADGVDLSQLASGDILIVQGDQGSTGSVARSIKDQQIVGQTSDLSANQGVTIGIKFADQSFTEIIEPIYEDNDYNGNNFWNGLAGLAPFLIFTMIGSGGFVMSKYNQRQKVKRSGTLVTQYYPPEGLTPAVGGYIDNDKFDTSDFMATLYDRGARGYLTISQETKSKFFGSKSTITYHKIKIPTDLLPYEQIIWDAMFGTSDVFDFDKLDQSRWANEEKNFFDTIKGAIVNEGKKYYDQGAFGGQKITDEGIRVFAHLRGYKDFIEKVEQDKLKEFLRQDPLFVDKILPWAVIFGCETQLVEHLEGLDWDQPTRYRGDVFNAIILNNMLTNSSRAIANTYESAYPKSSGGGFGGGGISVGGGGGGGGGGSR